jgi:hypothetical protein
MHSHSGEAGFTQLWWIKGAIFVTLTVVGVDKITTKGPLQWGSNGWIFFLTRKVSFLFSFFFK